MPKPPAPVQAVPLQPTAARPTCHDLPERWTAPYRQLARSRGVDNPLLRMGRRCEEELAPDGDALDDPTGERAAPPLPFLLHKHPDRALVLTTYQCFFHCRFCFRRGDVQRGPPTPTAADWSKLQQWLGEHPQVEEVILSGGDPLTLSDRELARIGRRLAQVASLRRWRIHTRAPVVLPQRVTPTLLAALAGPLPLRLVLHLNHPGEVSPPMIEAVRRIQRGGHRVLCQSVLLRGVNDCPQTLARLFRQLDRLGVVPHYLHHPDRAAGNRSFRVSIRRGRHIVRACRQRLASHDLGHCMPPYVLDLPNGAGKCQVDALRVVAQRHSATTQQQRYRWVRPAEWCATVPDRRYEWWDVSEPLPG